MINFKFKHNNFGCLVGERAYIDIGTFMPNIQGKRFGFGHYRLPYVDSEGVKTPEDPALSLQDLGFIIGHSEPFSETRLCTTECRTCKGLKTTGGLTKEVRYILPGRRTKDFYSQTTQTTQPKATQPKATQATQPKATQPKAAQPAITATQLQTTQTTQAKATQPKATQPKATQPKATQPKATQPRITATQPKTTQPKTTQPKKC
jgi:hypothetical protein